MEAGLNKKLFKIEILLLKVITIVIAFLHFLNIVISCFGIDNLIISYLASLGLLPLIFIYLASFTHGFCKHHRMFIIYVAVNNILCYLDYKYELPITDRHYITLHFIIAFIFLCLILYFKLKLCKKH